MTILIFIGEVWIELSVERTALAAANCPIDPVMNRHRFPIPAERRSTRINGCLQYTNNDSPLRLDLPDARDVRQRTSICQRNKCSSARRVVSRALFVPALSQLVLSASSSS